jgi:hypothetical protein
VIIRRCSDQEWSLRARLPRFCGRAVCRRRRWIGSRRTFSKRSCIVPPVPVPGTEHILLVPKVDADGNDVAGLRRPDDLETPLATVTGWNLRREGYRATDLCGFSGMLIPFPPTRADRLASHDPRLSIEERYPSQNDYVGSVALAALKLQDQRLLLPEDVDRIIRDAGDRDIFGTR